jgi:AAHS family 4-hydroxybenzoate transporter-like MFS transporter
LATAIRLTALFQIGGIGGALVLGALLDRVFSFWILAACYLWAAVCVFLHRRGERIHAVAWSARSPPPGWVSSEVRTPAMHSRPAFIPRRSARPAWLGRSGSAASDPIVGLCLEGCCWRAEHRLGRVFWAAAVPALIATLAAAGIASIITRGDPK